MGCSIELRTTPPVMPRMQAPPDSGGVRRLEGSVAMGAAGFVACGKHGIIVSMILHLHLVRHGQTTFNRYNRLQGLFNAPVTEAVLAYADKAA